MSGAAPKRIAVEGRGGVLEIRLARPEVRNAFDDALISELADALGLDVDGGGQVALGGDVGGVEALHVADLHGVNQLAAMCAIDRETLTTVCDYWAPGVEVTGISELVANALVMEGEGPRNVNLRLEPIPGREQPEEPAELAEPVAAGGAV